MALALFATPVGAAEPITAPLSEGTEDMAGVSTRCAALLFGIASSQTPPSDLLVSAVDVFTSQLLNGTETVPPMTDDDMIAAVGARIETYLPLFETEEGQSIVDQDRALCVALAGALSSRGE